LCELNVIEQVINVCETTIVQDAWAREQSLHVHGWIYGLKDGLLRDLGVSTNNADEMFPIHDAAIALLSNGGQR
jgi:carbonic anhydrase